MDDLLNVLISLSPIIVAVIVGIWGLIQKIQEFRSNKPKTNAEALEKIAGAATGMIDQYQEMLEEFKVTKKELEDSNEKLKNEVFKLRQMILVLVRQLYEAGLIPNINLDEITIPTKKEE